jgi:hypothetical protein
MLPLPSSGNLLQTSILSSIMEERAGDVRSFLAPFRLPESG